MASVVDRCSEDRTDREDQVPSPVEPGVSNDQTTNPVNTNGPIVVDDFSVCAADARLSYSLILHISMMLTPTG